MFKKCKGNQNEWRAPGLRGIPRADEGVSNIVEIYRASLVAHWQTILLPTQETQV